MRSHWQCRNDPLITKAVAGRSDSESPNSESSIMIPPHSGTNQFANSVELHVVSPNLSFQYTIPETESEDERFAKYMRYVVVQAALRVTEEAASWKELLREHSWLPTCRASQITLLGTDPRVIETITLKLTELSSGSLGISMNPAEDCGTPHTGAATAEFDEPQSATPSSNLEFPGSSCRTGCELASIYDFRLRVGSLARESSG